MLRYFDFIFILFVWSSSLLAMTPANTLIQNVVTIEYEISGSSFNGTSNIVSFNTDEVIIFSLVPNNPMGVLVESPQSDRVLSFTLNHDGNGPESYTINISQSVGDEFDVTSLNVYLDSNSNGQYDDGVDVIYSVGVNDPVMSSETSLNFFIVADIPMGLTGADESILNVNVVSNTGAGAAGTIYAGGGVGGVDALMGLQGGSLTTNSKFVVASAIANLVKASSILDPFGGSNPVKDAVITYSLTLNVSGVGNISNVLITDPIPSGTTYQAGTLKLDGNPLTDTVDLDSGLFNGSEVRVELPVVAAPAVHIVSFAVKIL